ncbi:meiosis regulator and mRNA stability factor 1-like protein isoform X4 [Rhynchophorus ferrugineus]|uniref:meiosis regulator and mRNA stability factor 1-like protein isoform X4 n=1 Tax=Rhynchophorus ferrugineus TaxID=354439 RepID=UPI003FCD35CB
MTSRPSSSNEKEKRDQENQISSNCTGTKPKMKFPAHPSLNVIENNSSQSDSSTSSVTFDSFTVGSYHSTRRTKKRSGFAKKLPPMGIFWDIENVQVPKQKSAASVVQRIREVFLDNYREAEFVVVCDVKKEKPQILQDLHDSQVNLIHVSSTSKNAADEKLKQSLRRFAEFHPAPSAIILISGDINFAGDLSDLRYRKKINVYLLCHERATKALILCANEHHDFYQLMLDLPKCPTIKPPDSPATYYIKICNLPRKIKTEKIKNRLHLLTANCGGKIVEFFPEEDAASLKFGSYDLALRAQKRIQGEDVFGNKIRVLSPSIRNFNGHKVEQKKGDKSQQVFSGIPPPPGFNFDYKQTVYPYSSSGGDIRDFRRRHQEALSGCGLPMALNKTSMFRPINPMGASAVSPMDISFEQQTGHYTRSAPVSRIATPQDHLYTSLGSYMMPPFGRVHKVSGSSELSDSEAKNYLPSDISTKSQNNQPIDLNITNLDPNIEIKELRRLLSTMITEYVMILNLNIVIQADGTPIANLRVSSQHDAQYVISQLHRQKLGRKRIIISYTQTNSPDPDQLKMMVISILQEVIDKKMPLFKFMEQLELKYHCTVSVSEVNKLKDVVKIYDEMGSRMISLTQEAKISPTHNLSQMMVPYCIIHCPKGLQNRSWFELNSSFIPNIMMSLSVFTNKLLTLLNIHMGSMSLLSFQECFEQECHESLPISENGVPLEHLVTCVPNVEIKLVGPNKNVKVIQQKLGQLDIIEDQSRIAPSLVPNVNLLCREVVDLLKTTERCQLLLTKFIPAYHHHFGRQCRVADYGYTKLLDLFESISHVVQIMGDGTRRVITLTHSAQMRRFTSDLLRVLKVQPNKQISFTDFPLAYEKVLNKPFNPVEYGLCTFNDLLQEVPENTVVINRNEMGILISVPKREQTPEEVIRTKQFASEVIDLLRHTPYYTMLFNRFVPSYHHHFGHQCKVSDYGFSKLTELFEAIPDVVEIKELFDGERIVSLTQEQSLKMLAAQVIHIAKGLAGSGLKLDDLPKLYAKEYGYPLNPQVYQCETIVEVIEKLSDYVQVIHSNAGTLLRPIDMDTLPNILRVRCWALLLDPPHVKEMVSFKYEYQTCFNSSFSMETLREISNVISISSMNNVEFVSLTALYVLAAQLYYIICKNGGSIIFSHLEKVYMDHYNKPLKLSNFNINSMNEFYNNFSSIFYIKSNKKKCVVVLNRNLQDHISQLAVVKENETKVDISDETNEEPRWGIAVGSVQNDDQGAKKKYSPPKPDTPPTPGSTWNTPTKFENSLSFSVNVPISLNPTLMGNTDHLVSPARYLTSSPWNPTESLIVAPEPTELPLPDKLLRKNLLKEGMSDDSADSGVNIKLDNSPSDNEFECSSDNRGGPKNLYGKFLSFK